MNTTNSISSLADGITLQALGGAGTVTGSKYLLHMPSFNLLIDCGLFQGLKSLRERNRAPLPIDAGTIDAVILTHAHLDHCGYLPLLIKNGFNGKIYMSAPTCALTELILRDSAKLQEEDAEKANRNGYSKHRPAKPLYDTNNVEACLPHFVQIGLDENFTLNKNISFRLFPAGHITGACSVLVNAYSKKIFFSGDIGRFCSEFIKPPKNNIATDAVVMESTYGDRLHEDYDIDGRLALLVDRTLQRNGNILIPCFAAGRAQEIIYRLHRLKMCGQIPKELPIYLDSPMADNAVHITMRYPEWLVIDPGEAGIMDKGIIINEHASNTAKIIRKKGNKIIIAASGMLTGGRALEYLKHYLPDHRNTILLIGFQAAGTRGRALLNHVRDVKIHGHYYPVKAHIEYIDALSAHADQAELLHWLKNFKLTPEKIFLVHGEPCAMEALRIKVKDTIGVEPIILQPEESVVLSSALKPQELAM